MARKRRVFTPFKPVGTYASYGFLGAYVPQASSANYHVKCKLPFAVYCGITHVGELAPLEQVFDVLVFTG